MANINKKLFFILAFSFLLLLALLYYKTALRKNPKWDNTFTKTTAFIEVEKTHDELRKCTSSGSNECDQQLEQNRNKFQDANFYYAGYEHCIKRFGKNAEDCRKLLESVRDSEGVQELLPSKTLDRNGIE